jgi:hypothetical protein
MHLQNHGNFIISMGTVLMGLLVRIATAHEPIRSPLHYHEASVPSLVKNAYAQIQDWDNLYLHPGVDLFESPGTPVYSVSDGIVRAILTTGDERYWRIAIEKLDGSGVGYLYAHLDQDSFLFGVGDTVRAGDMIGVIFPAWGFEPHCHFARIMPEGGVWNGNWWTVDNPLVDIVNMTDTLPPVFENAVGGDLFAFRTRDGVYLDPMSLCGGVRIISKCRDYAYSLEFESIVNIWDIRFALFLPQAPDSAIYERFCFAMDMPLDTYLSGSYETLVLNTLYSRDAVCFSTNNSYAKDFFYIITNSNGDSAISAEDSLQVFDTTFFPDGAYLLKVYARDASGNETMGMMPIAIRNAAAVNPGSHKQPENLIRLYQNQPNPFNVNTTISFTLPEPTTISLVIYDEAGRVVSVPLAAARLGGGFHQMYFNGGPLASGRYFCRLVSERGISVKTMVLIK